MARDTDGMGQMSKRRVLIVDDHPIVRQGLRRLLEKDVSGLTVCGEAEDVREALELVE